MEPIAVNDPWFVIVVMGASYLLIKDLMSRLNRGQGTQVEHGIDLARVVTRIDDHSRRIGQLETNGKGHASAHDLNELRHDIQELKEDVAGLGVKVEQHDARTFEFGRKVDRLIELFVRASQSSQSELKAA